MHSIEKNKKQRKNLSKPAGGWLRQSLPCLCFNLLSIFGATTLGAPWTTCSDFVCISIERMEHKPNGRSRAIKYEPPFTSGAPITKNASQQTLWLFIRCASFNNCQNKYLEVLSRTFLGHSQHHSKQNYQKMLRGLPWSMCSTCFCI